MFVRRANFAALAVVLAGIVLAEPPETFELTWHTIDSGGGVSTGGEFELAGTIGQPDASNVMSGGDFELTGGYRFRIDQGDCNTDGGVNVFDYAELAACVNGPGNEPIGLCVCVDFDRDNDVDLDDYAAFQNTLIGLPIP